MMARCVALALLLCDLGARLSAAARIRQIASRPEEYEVEDVMDYEDYDNENEWVRIDPNADGKRLEESDNGGSELGSPARKPRASDNDGSELGSPAQQTATQEDCQDYIMMKTTEAMDRITAFFGGDCGVSEGDLVPRGGGDAGELEATPAGREAICQKSCLENLVLHSPSPSFADLKDKCGDAKALALAARSFALHDAMSAAWQECFRREHKVMKKSWKRFALLLETARRQVPSGPSSPGSADMSKAVTSGEAHQPPRRERSPRCLGKRVVQENMAFQLTNVLMLQRFPTCRTVIDAFAMLDYKKAGRVTLAEVDWMLDVLGDDLKADLMARLRAIAGDKDSVAFGDFANAKLGRDTVFACMLDYTKEVQRKA